MCKAEFYTTVEHEGYAEFEEKKSVFISHALPVKSEEEAAAFVKKIKNEYRDARHNVFAYVLGSTVQKYSDDGEPQGSAGMPVLDVIRKNGCTDTAVVVTRYFGGILLGVGGLVRAYSHSAKLALDAAHIITYEKYSLMRLSCSYSDYGKYSAELARFGVTDAEPVFSENATLKFSVKSAREAELDKFVTELSFGKAKAEKTGEKFDYK